MGPIVVSDAPPTSTLKAVLDLHAATVLFQWATGGLFFLWVTTRQRIVSLGYGWLLRGTYAVIALSGVAAGVIATPYWPRDVPGAAMAVAAVVVNAVSYRYRKAGVAGQRDVVEKRSSRVAAMTGIDRDEQRFDKAAPEFSPALDLIAPSLGAVSLIAASVHAGGPLWLAIARVFVGAAFLGVVTDAMLLGHWYLTQPGLPRAPLLDLVRWSMLLYPFELIVMLVPTGMISVLNGAIDDGYEGFAGWFWVMSAVATGGLLVVTRLALKERQYSAVMAATGLLYLALLMAFVMDIVARILLDA